MRVLVLGGTGYIGSRLVTLLRRSGWAFPVSGSSRGASRGTPDAVRVDTRDPVSLERALQDMDAVVNCVAGDAKSIADGAAHLAKAAAAAGCSRLVHLSTMSVYGTQEGVLDESAATDPNLGWYGRAKCEAETRIQGFADAGGTAVVLRPGCVWGPGSELWVGRVGRWLASGRLGDLGAAGDGWSNLVHVDDVCAAIAAALRLAPAPRTAPRLYNLAAPDSPRWNSFFVDLGVAIGATPVRRLAPQQLKLDAWIGGPPLHLARTALSRAGRSADLLPDPLTPGLLGLWQRHLKLDARAAERELGLRWTPYRVGLAQSAAWFLKSRDYTS